MRVSDDEAEEYGGFGFMNDPFSGVGLGLGAGGSAAAAIGGPDWQLEALARDPAAEAAAAAYRAKRKSLSVPVLCGGGGSSAKLGCQHALITHQLVLLLRHSVRAFPPRAVLE